MKKAFAQYRLLINQGFRAELADLERLISPFLFAITILVLFSFAIGKVDNQIAHKIFVAQTFLTIFFALQITFSRVFEPDRADMVFDVLRSYPIAPVAWFLGKLTLVIIIALLVLIPTVFIAAMMAGDQAHNFLTWPVAAIISLALIGLAALGVLLSALTLRASARQILYPLLYFPLTTPVLLASVQASLLYLEKAEVNANVLTWGGLLVAFDVIYFTLGVMLFEELILPE